MPILIQPGKALSFLGFDNSADNLGGFATAVGKVVLGLDDIDIILDIAPANRIVNHIDRHLGLEQVTPYRLVGCLKLELERLGKVGADEIMIPIIGNSTERALFISIVDKGQGRL